MPNDMPQPGQQGPIIPPITPPPPPPVNSRLEAEVARNLAQATREAEPEIARFIDNMRKMGKGWTEISKYADDLYRVEMRLAGMRRSSVEDLKRIAPEFNLSIEQLKKMPLRDFAKNLDSVAISVLKTHMPLATMGTMLTATAFGIMKVSEAFANMNRMASAFQVQSGALLRGGFSPTLGDKAAFAASSQQMSLMGLRDRREQERLLSAVAASLPASMGSAAQGRAASAAVALGASTNTSPEEAARVIGEIVRFNMPIRLLTDTLGVAAKDIKDLPFAESAAAMTDLWRSTRNLGTTLPQAERTVASFQRELSAGILTVRDLEQLSPGKASFMESAKFVQMAAAAGVRMPGGPDIMSQVSAYKEMRPEQQADIYKRITEFFAAKVNGGQVTRGSMTLAQELVGLNVPENLKMELQNLGKGGVGQALAPLRPQTAADMGAAFDKLIQENTKMASETATVTEQIKRLGAAAMTAGEAITDAAFERAVAPAPRRRDLEQGVEIGPKY